jgi:6-phosphogluconolactonase/glucosamine-6-phosphate isomerase/deaminase
MNIVQEKDSSQLLTQTTAFLNRTLEQNHNNPVLLMLSGGSALNILSGIHAENLGEHVTITVLDERYTVDPKINNFAQIRTLNFFETAQSQKCNFIDTQVQKTESLLDAAHTFESSLQEWKKKYPLGKVIITQGMGPDGHTAGIFPYPEDRVTFDMLFNKDNWVVGYDAGNKNQYSQRFTTTMTFLQKYVDVSIVYITGQEKKLMLNEVLHGGKALHEVPMKVIHTMKAQINLFTDIVL